jgi:hypothetical protein
MVLEAFDSLTGQLWLVGRSVKLLLGLASTDISDFRSCQEPLQRFLLTQEGVRLSV